MFKRLIVGGLLAYCAVVGFALLLHGQTPGGDARRAVYLEDGGRSHYKPAPQP